MSGIGVGDFIVSNLHIDDNSILRLYSKIIRPEGWKGQNPSKTFRFEGSFVENLQLEGYNSRPGLLQWIIHK